MNSLGGVAEHSVPFGSSCTRFHCGDSTGFRSASFGLLTAFSAYIARSAASSISSRVLPSLHSDMPTERVRSKPSRCPELFQSSKYFLMR
jgi:hypothetical protein